MQSAGNYYFFKNSEIFLLAHNQMHARKSAPEFAGKTGARQDLLAGCEIFSNGTKKRSDPVELVLKKY